jgi:hypothetical protein
MFRNDRSNTEMGEIQFIRWVSGHILTDQLSTITLHNELSICNLPEKKKKTDQMNFFFFPWPHNPA